MSELPARLLDVGFRGTAGAIASYWVDGFLIDPGPASCVEKLLAKLPGEPHTLLLTHIHLDHAGAAGTLCRLFPGLRVHVHERGLPHLADPSRLLASAERLYGPNLGNLFGRTEPVPADRLVALAGGERIDRFRVEYVPGHASHHVAYVDTVSGAAFVGDACGVRVTADPVVVAPTPPPDIDVEAWLRSLEAVERLRPSALCLTHFGIYSDVERHLVAMRASLGDLVALARSCGRDEFEPRLRARLAEALDASSLRRLEVVAPLDQLFLGLERYLRKRAEVKDSRP